MTIIIREYEICTENLIKHWIVCLEPGRRIDRHAYREDTVLQNTDTDIPAPFGLMR